MRPLKIFLISIIFFLLASYGSAVTPQVVITNTSITPPVLMKGDIGTITVTVTNNGDTTTLIKSATLVGGEFLTASDSYQTVGYIRPSNKIELTFIIKAFGEDGFYYPHLVLEFDEGTRMSQVIPVQVENTSLTVALLDKPNYISIGESGEYILAIGNPRQNEVNSVQVITEGSGIDAFPSSFFIGSLGIDKSVTVPFNITPDHITQAKFRVIFRNGVNEHEASISIPLVPSENKKSAAPLVSNITISQEGEIYQIVGVVNNAGLSPAKSVIIKTDSPAIPVDPYKIYVVGSLDPDNFSSFEVTFRLPNTGTIPLIVDYKDTDGNRFISQTQVDVTVAPLADQSASFQKFGTILVWILVFVIAAAIFYSWRKR